MRRYLSTSDGLATAIGVAILVATTNANIMATGGYFTSHAIVVAALSAGVFAGARVIGAGAAGKIAVAIVLALAAGEFYNLSATAERIVIERETNAAPLRDAHAKHDAALGKLSAADAAAPATARLTLALAVKSKAQAAYEKELREGGRCKTICNGLKDDAARAAAEVTAAAQEAQQLHAKAIEAAKAEVAANPLPASATPFADRIGWAPWALDLLVAALLSLGANGLAGTLIAYGAHRDAERPDVAFQQEQRRTIVPANDCRSITESNQHVCFSVASAPNDPEPPKGKRRKPEIGKGVVDLHEHRVWKAIERNGGSVSSHQELADLLGIDPGPASRLRQEIDEHLELTKVGKQLRIALRA